MHPSRFDRLTRTLAIDTNRRVLGGLLAAALGVPVARAAVAQSATPAAGREPMWLYVQAFASATLAPDPSASGKHALILTGLDEAVLGFTDRPDRQVMTLPTAQFVAMVADQAANPLNATLAAPLAGGEPAMVVVELVSAEHDAAAGTVIYRVAVLAEEEGEVRALATPLAAPTEEQVFGSGHVFIDGCGPGCYQCPGGCTCQVNSQCMD